MAEKFMSCSVCRKDIMVGDRYYVCSVSTCNRDRTKLVFCSVTCWDSHVAVLRHRDAWAVEATAGEPVPQQEADPEPPRAAPSPAVQIRSAAPAPAIASGSGPTLAPASEDDVLIVVSKMKKYIKDRSGLSTSDGVTAALSDHVRAICDQAIRNAVGAGRKTVMDRDVPPVRK